MERIILSWSSGKDCAMALHEIRKSGRYDVAALLTTVTERYDRVSMHGVRRALLERQAESVGIPLEIVLIEDRSTNESYERKMTETLTRLKSAGFTKVAFGDIFLEELRKYREEKMALIGMEALFPLWKRDTGELSRTLCSSGFRSVITCVDTNVLDRRFAGRIIDAELLSELPGGVDKCGENGEFHSFAFDGPVFRAPVRFTPGEKVLRDERFYFCDLVPV